MEKFSGINVETQSSSQLNQNKSKKLCEQKKWKPIDIDIDKMDVDKEWCDV